ncbi:hypothetical protein BV25DRAFT_1798630 [Artomyces pyxidatus]|uniref:Uncharacterized protein n=1 Tax=Artomyces pyxidatus TaxID=48021 RepID=A0ACB8TAG7_9AGAM|nr:hypothetical protein BV25DRAFT_1798630 [Artomyces pyxidatus]
MSLPLPAHHTKHLSRLDYPFLDSRFSLSQLADGHSNGTALWLGAQCLSSYLAVIHKKLCRHSRPRALELGSGIGLTALAMRSLGWDIVATDTRHVIAGVLSPNIAANTGQSPPNPGVVQIRELDWTVPPEEWDWDHPAVIASTQTSTLSLEAAKLYDSPLKPPFDLIISSDTLYTTELVTPLLRTLHAVSAQSLVLASRPPPIYLCIERRDSAVIDRALFEAQTDWGFTVERIAHRKVLKAMEKGGLNWAKEDWDDVEIWKLVQKMAVKS